MYRLIVFDLDGTLVDSRRDLADSVNVVLQASGASPLPIETVGGMVGSGAASLVARAFAASGIEPPGDALQRFLDVYETRLLIHTRPYDGISDVLALLCGHASLAVLTNKPLAATHAILAGLDLVRYFPDEAIVGGDGPFPRKPDPSGLQHLMDRVAASLSETVLVGDSAIDWRTARNALTAVCLARYGFGFEGLSTSDLGPGDRVVDAPEELIQLLEA